MRTFYRLSPIVWLLAGPLAFASVNIPTVLVGDAGNPAQSVSNRNHAESGGDGFGAVPYVYRIGAYPVTNAQYAAFLNAVAATDTHGLWKTGMGTTEHGGISRSGSPGNYTYHVRIATTGFNAGQSMGNMPVNHVTFWDAARFANWLTNGQPTGLQGLGTTETGVYHLGGVTNPANSAIGRDSIVWGNGGVAVASENEWYKAAYYRPGTQTYALFPTGSNHLPTAGLPNAMDPNSANFNHAVGTVTPVGGYALAASAYGTFDQGGNVWEWNDQIASTSGRIVRGAAFLSPGNLQSSVRVEFPPNLGSASTGFRVASLVPISEPVGLLLSYSDWLAWASLSGQRGWPLGRGGPLGLTNLLAYAMGLNPDTATPANLPRVAAVDRLGARARIIVNRAPLAAGVRLIIEESSDLKQWDEADIESVVDLEIIGKIRRKSLFTVLFTDPSVVFFRVRAIVDPVPGPPEVSGDFHFGSLTPNQPAVQRIVVLSNPHDSDLLIGEWILPDGFMAEEIPPLIPAGGSDEVVITFLPVEVGEHGGNLSLQILGLDTPISLSLSAVVEVPEPGSMLQVNGGILHSAVVEVPEPGSMLQVNGGILHTTNHLDGTAVPPFQIGSHEVTWGEWQSVRGWAVINGYAWPGPDGNGKVPTGCTDHHPVIYVSWFDALKWCNAKSEREGLTPVYRVGDSVYRSGEPDHNSIQVNPSANGFRLPLEAEWEFAARGGNRTVGYTYAGSNDVHTVAWYLGNSEGAQCGVFGTHGPWPVGQKASNELGLHDMSGNVSEWCWDRAESISFRRLRGGSWFSSAEACAVSFGRDVFPSHRDMANSFRLARTPSP